MSVDPFFQNNQEDIEEAMRRFAPKPPRPVIDTRMLIRSMGDVVLGYESRLREDSRTWTTAKDIRRRRRQKKRNLEIRNRAHAKMILHAAKEAHELKERREAAKVARLTRKH